jgi:hypothetical protein
MRPTMGNSFLQKFVLMIAAGFVAAGMIYVFRHVVQQAIWESGEGWQENLRQRPTGPKK